MTLSNSNTKNHNLFDTNEENLVVIEIQQQPARSCHQNSSTKKFSVSNLIHNDKTFIDRTVSRSSESCHLQNIPINNDAACLISKNSSLDTKIDISQAYQSEASIDNQRSECSLHDELSSEILNYETKAHQHRCKNHQQEQTFLDKKGKSFHSLDLSLDLWKVILLIVGSLLIHITCFHFIYAQWWHKTFMNLVTRKILPVTV